MMNPCAHNVVQRMWSSVIEAAQDLYSGARLFCHTVLLFYHLKPTFSTITGY